MLGDAAVEIDIEKIDDVVLGLLYLTLHDGCRAWKGHDWDALGRLHRWGMICDPVGKAKSVVFTEERLVESEWLLTGLPPSPAVKRITPSNCVTSNRAIPRRHGARADRTKPLAPFSPSGLVQEWKAVFTTSRKLSKSTGMNRTTLRYFVTVSQLGSIRHAAEQLNVAQSAVSRQIMRLEEELGVPLLDRLPRGIKLSSAGEVLLRHARDILAQMERIGSEMSALKGLRAGMIRVAAAETFTHDLLPRCIEAFRRRYPGVTFVAHVGSTAGVMEAVREGLVDFGIAYNPPGAADILTRFSVRERLVAVMSGRHMLAGRDQLSMTDLAEVPLTLPPPKSATRTLLDAVARASGVTLRSMVDSDSVQLRLRIAETSDVVALLARVTALQQLGDGRLVEVRLRERQLNQGRIETFSLAGRQMSVAAEEFERSVQRELEGG